MNTPHPIGRLHVLTDTTHQSRYTHAELARLALEGGADTIQFRQKTGTHRARYAEAEAVLHVCAQAGQPLLIDDHLDLVLALEAAGVHLGQEDLPLSAARRMAPTHIIGATATSTEQAIEAWKSGADYIGFGPVFHTTSKANPASVKGLKGLAAAVAAVPIPVIAIAGITVARVPDVLAAGAHGIAVMSAVICEEDPVAATAAFVNALGIRRDDGSDFPSAPLQY